jgi:hypothetical protein
MLHPAAALGLEPEEVVDLVAALATLWDGAGIGLAAPAPERWYLRLPAIPAIATQPLDRVAGEYLTSHLPQGADAPRLMGLVNESQMLLHEHAVNRARESAGHPPVNGLWLWGGGILPEMRSGPDGVASDAPEVRALAAAAGIAARPAATSLEEFIDGARCRRGLTTLDPGPRDIDLGGYLAKLERLWFRPLLLSLALGRLRHLRLDLLARPARSASITTPQAWRFWR